VALDPRVVPASRYSQHPAHDRYLVLLLVPADKSEFQSGSRVLEKMAMAFLVCPSLGGGFHFLVLACSVRLLHHSGDLYLEGLLHPRQIAPFLIERPLPQVDLTRVKTEFSLQISLGLAAALEQSQ